MTPPSTATPGQAVDLLPLHLLASGQTGQVEHLMGDSESVRRLHEMGLREGTKVEMLRPGDPCIVRVAEARYCFRKGAGLGVLVSVPIVD